MAQWLRALVALPEDWGSIPSTHRAAHNFLSFQFQGTQQLHTDICSHNMHAHEMKISHLKKWKDRNNNKSPQKTNIK